MAVQYLIPSTLRPNEAKIFQYLLLAKIIPVIIFIPTFLIIQHPNIVRQYLFSPIAKIKQHQNPIYRLNKLLENNGYKFHHQVRPIHQ